MPHGKPHQVQLAAVRRRVENLVRARGKTLDWLYERSGVSKSTYLEMWGRGSVRVLVLQDLANALDITLPELLTPPAGSAPSAAAIASEPVASYGRPYLEQRVEALEHQVRELRAQLRTTKPHTR